MAARRQQKAEAPGWPADKVERRPMASLIPYARNARTHSEEQVAQIAASIREFGWTVPVLVDEDGTIIAGHGRVLAGHKLGLPEAPVMVAAGWSKAQKQAYALADNQLALNAGWDDALLKVEIADLHSAGFELGLTAIDAETLGKLLDPGEPKTGEGRGLGGDPVIAYNIVFDSDDQQQVWFGLLRQLRERYPDVETVAGRLTAWINDAAG